MRMRAALLLLLAVVLGASAVFLARNWLAAQLASRMPAQTEQAAAPQVGKIVVAAVPLRFGNRIGAEHLKEVSWPTGAMPPGSFASSKELLTGEPRVVLYAMEPNEPVLASKITGPGQRASLSALVDEGMRAVTIRVNDVLGVAGFVLPGDRVDILLTREISKDNPVTDVLLQNVRVLGIDQLADEQRDQPMVVKAVTLEVTTEQAQKLTLASTVGTLGLALRGVAYVATERVKRIDVQDLSVGEAIKPEKSEAKVSEKEPEKKAVRVIRRIDPNAKVGITRGLVREEYTVTPENLATSKPLPLTPPPAPAAPQAAPGAPLQIVPVTPPADAVEPPATSEIAPKAPPASAPGQPLLRGFRSASRAAL